MSPELQKEVARALRSSARIARLLVAKRGDDDRHLPSTAEKSQKDLVGLSRRADHVDALARQVEAQKAGGS